MIYGSAAGVAALPTCAMKASVRERCDALMASSGALSTIRPQLIIVT